MKRDFESKMKELEEINDALASGGITLEDAVEKYRKGMKLADELEATLAAAETEIAVLLNRPEEENQTPSFTAWQDDGQNPNGESIE